MGQFIFHAPRTQVLLRLDGGKGLRGDAAV